MEIIIISMFIAKYLHGDLNIEFRVRKMIKGRKKKITVLACLPCLTWWTAILTSIVFIFIDNGPYCTPEQAINSKYILQPMAAFLAAHLIQNNVSNDQHQQRPKK